MEDFNAIALCIARAARRAPTPAALRSLAAAQSLIAPPPARPAQPVPRRTKVARPDDDDRLDVAAPPAAAWTRPESDQPDPGLDWLFQPRTRITELED